jgi:RNA polymerase-associated protein CTR9
VLKAPSSAINRRRRAWSESDEDEPPEMMQRESSPPAGDRENSAELPESDGEIRENDFRDDESDKPNRDAGDDDEVDD